MSIRILIATGLFPPDIGGPATYSRFLAELLPRYGYEVTVLSFSRVRNLWPVIRHIAYFFLVVKHASRAQVIYAQDTFSVGLPSAVANVFLRKKFMVRVPGDHVWEQGTARFGITEPLEKFPNFGKDWHPLLTLMRLLQLFVVKSADVLVVPSRYMEKVVAKWGIGKKNVRLIYNGVEELSDTGNKAVLRGLLKFQGKLVIAIGRLVKWKGFDELIALVPEWKKAFPGMKLLVVGTGPLAEELEKKTNECGVHDDVIFTGQLERDVLIRYIRASDVFILNSRYEGLSHQILEVMQVGVPVVATRAGGNPEVIEDGVNGYLIAPGDKGTLRDRVSALLSDSNLRAKIVAQGRRTVKRFSNEAVARETAALIEKICV